MKWLRVWFAEPEDEVENLQTGTVIGTHPDYSLTVRLDSGEIICTWPSSVEASCWVDNPSAKVKMPKSFR